MACAHSSAMSQPCQETPGPIPGPGAAPTSGALELPPTPPLLPRMGLPSPEPRHTPTPSPQPSPEQRQRLMKPRPGKERDKINRREQGGRQEAGQGLGVPAEGSGGVCGAWTSSALCADRPNEIQVVPWPRPAPAPDSVSGAGEGKGHCSRGAGPGGWPGAQHITLGGHSLGQQTPSRSEPSSEPSSQHGGRGPGRGPCGLSPPCAEGPHGQSGAVTSLSQRRWGWQGRPGVPGGAGSCEGQVQGDGGSGAGR